MEQIEEINKHISDALEQWQDIMLNADADEWAYHLDYTDQDLLNAMYIFMHVASNKAIKSGFIKDEHDAETKAVLFSSVVETCLGFNTAELTDKVLKNEG